MQACAPLCTFFTPGQSPVNNFYEKAIYMSESDLCNLCALKRAGLEVSRGPAELEIVDNQEHAIRHWEVFQPMPGVRFGRRCARPGEKFNIAIGGFLVNRKPGCAVHIDLRGPGGLDGGAYAPALRCQFLAFDDQAYVTENRLVRAGLTLDGFVSAFRVTTAGNWHPLTLLSHMLDCQIYGLRPWGHHLTSVLFHAANAVLLFLC